MFNQNIVCKNFCQIDHKLDNDKIAEILISILTITKIYNIFGHG